MPSPIATPTPTPTPTQLFSLVLNNDYSFSLTISVWVLALAVVAFLVFLIMRSGPIFRWRRNFEIDKAEIGIGSGKLSFKPNLEDQQIAYAIWVELSTRKIGLPIDLKHDVIWEIYESWHTFFSVTRELIKDIPVSKLRNDSTKKIILLSIDVLNKGLRPHLTFWHARFRRWYERESQNSHDEIDPQALQEKYPKYAELSQNLLEVNRSLIKYRSKMAELVLGLDDAELTVDLLTSLDESTKRSAPEKPHIVH
jgi:hypothetical protein